MNKEIVPQGEFLIYQTEDGQVKLNLRLEDETVWLSQQMMAELFNTSKQNIGQHIRNIYDEEELLQEATVKKFLTVQIEGSRQINRQIDFYNLDMILSVGYRVKSLIATRFRIWATQQLKEYIVKGFVMDDERLKNPSVNGVCVPDYFEEMLERIRDIRASERRMYLRITDIFAMATDYDAAAQETRTFFMHIQNKLHFAATGKTAAEIISTRADATLENMGLTSWQKDEIRKTDVTVAKNYLVEEEIKELNRIVVMWLDYAEDQAKRRKQVYMQDWQQKLNAFLEFNEREVLSGGGSIRSKQAREHAKTQYDIFAERRCEQKELRGAKDYVKQLTEKAKELKNTQENTE